MNKTKTGISLSLLLLIGLAPYGGQRLNNKLLLNEALIDSQNSFQDNYGLHSVWIEIFNKLYGSADLTACLLKVSSQSGDIITYFIPKGDILALVKLRRRTLFWADGEPNRETLHTSFRLNSETANWAGLFDSGRKLLDQIAIPVGTLGPNQSYAHISDGAVDQEVKGGSRDKYVAPSINNKILDGNAKMEKLEEHDSVSIGVSISAMSVIFCGLIFPFIALKVVGRIAVNLNKRNAMKTKGTDKIEAKELSQASDEVYAVISVVLYEIQDEVHDVEKTVPAITHVKHSYSPWSSEIYALHGNPNRK